MYIISKIWKSLPVKDWLLIVLCSVLLVFIWSVPVLAFDLKIATAAPNGSKWMTEMQSAAKKISEQTEGRVRLKIYGGGVMGNDRSVFRKMRIGQLHGGTFTGGELSGLAPEAALYSLPMIFHTYDEVDYVRNRMDVLLQESFIASGYECFGFVEAGFARLMSSYPVAKLADLNGRKVWVPEGDKITYDFMQALGLAPVTLPMTDVMTGLQTNLIDVIAAPSSGALAFQWHTRVNHMNNLPLAYVYASLLVTQKAMERISHDDRQVVRENLYKAISRLDRESREDNQKAFQALVAAGLTLVKTNSADAENWRKKSAPALESALARANLLDRYQQIKVLLDEQRHLTGAGRSKQLITSQ
jgi:TRAP-type C4-dicarboxylate transport system substrate-binding protein